MKVEKGDVLSFQNNKYIVIETLNYNYEQYLFVNKLLSEEELSEDYHIFKKKEKELELIVDESLINKLLEKFKILINEDLNDILEKNQK